MLVAFFLLLLIHWSHLSKWLDKKEKELTAEREINVAMANVINAYQENDSANRIAITRQLVSERVIHHEYEERIRQFKSETISDPCAVQRMPDPIISLLQE